MDAKINSATAGFLGLISVGERLLETIIRDKINSRLDKYGLVKKVSMELLEPICA